MTATLLYPRLSLIDAQRIFAERLSVPVEEIGSLGELQHPNQTFAATGGMRVTTAHLEVLRTTIRAVAIWHGWPMSPSIKQRSKFDAECSAALLDLMDIIPSDAGSGEVWMFITNVLCPEIAPWRWPSRNERRFLDHSRNTFRSLYWRGYVLDPSRLHLFGEDEIVAVIERPSLSANPDTARAIFDTFAVARTQLQRASSMDVMRDYAKRLRRFSSFVSFDALDTDQRDALLTEVLRQTLDALGETDVMLPDIVVTEGHAAVPSSPVQSDFGVGEPRDRTRRHRSDFTPLWKILTERRSTEWRLPFDQVEAVLGFEFGDDLRRHPEQWHEEGFSNLARAIRDAGWTVRALDFEDGVVTLVRSEPT